MFTPGPSRPSPSRLTFSLIGFVAILIVALPIACTSRSSGTTTQVADDAEDFDSETTTTTTSNTANTDDQLFDTDLDEAETTQTTQMNNFGTVSTTERSCLASGFGNYGQYSDEPQSSTNTNSCLSTQQTGARIPLSRDTFFQAGIAAYSDINDCFDEVLLRAPRNEQEAPSRHVAGRMALVRCYRERVLGGMRGRLPWGNRALSNYDTQYDNLGVLLRLLSQRSF